MSRSPHQLGYFGCCLLAFALAVGLGSDVHAVVLNFGDGSGNTTAPADDPGFANTGQRGSGSAIYLGNRWVLTANHVGAGSVTFGATVFEHDPDQTQRLTNPAGKSLSTNTDLVLFRLTEEPDLPSLRIGCHDISLSSEVLLVGAGRDRDPELSLWDIDFNGGDNDDVWTQVDSEESADVSGYRTNASRSIRWGESIVTQTRFDVDSGHGDVLSFQTSFEEFSILNQTEVGQAVTGDSGGPVFQQDGEFWNLVGMIHAVSPPKENQPGGVGTVLLGNHTFIANLSEYGDLIREIADFEPEPGDFNGSGEIDASDIDLLYAAIGENHNCHFDLSGNGLVTQSDMDQLLSNAGTLMGDTDLDGKVGFSDFLLLADTFGEAGLGWAGSDFDGDGSTNFGDFIMLSNSFGNVFAPDVASPIVSVAAVPEPSGFGILLVGFAAFLLLRSQLSLGPKN